MPPRRPRLQYHLPSPSAQPTTSNVRHVSLNTKNNTSAFRTTYIPAVISPKKPKPNSPDDGIAWQDTPQNASTDRNDDPEYFQKANMDGHDELPNAPKRRRTAGVSGYPFIG